MVCLHLMLLCAKLVVIQNPLRLCSADLKHIYYERKILVQIFTID
jgi:hypothetical protein